jgi:hypothetical protein
LVDTDEDDNITVVKSVERDQLSSEDNTFEAFQAISDQIGGESGRLKKNEILRTFFTEGIKAGK